MKKCLPALWFHLKKQKVHLTFLGVGNGETCIKSSVFRKKVLDRVGPDLAYWGFHSALVFLVFLKLTS